MLSLFYFFFPKDSLPAHPRIVAQLWSWCVLNDETSSCLRFHLTDIIWNWSTSRRSKSTATVSGAIRQKNCGEEQLWWYLSEPRGLTKPAKTAAWLRNTPLFLPLRANRSNHFKRLHFRRWATKAIVKTVFLFFFPSSENTAQALWRRAAPLIKDGKIKPELKLSLFMSDELGPVSRRMDPDFTAAEVVIGSQISPWNRISKSRSFFFSFSPVWSRNKFLFYWNRSGICMY